VIISINKDKPPSKTAAKKFLSKKKGEQAPAKRVTKTATLLNPQKNEFGREEEQTQIKRTTIPSRKQQRPIKHNFKRRLIKSLTQTLIIKKVKSVHASMEKAFLPSKPNKLNWS